MKVKKKLGRFFIELNLQRSTKLLKSTRAKNGWGPLLYVYGEPKFINVYNDNENKSVHSFFYFIILLFYYMVYTLYL